MNALLHWLASDGWTPVVWALLHTLWQGTVVALVLWAALRRTTNPVWRHRICLLGLAGVLVAGLATWALLTSPKTARQVAVPAAVTVATRGDEHAANSGAAIHFSTPGEVGDRGTETPVPAGNRRIAWLALIWLTGAALMLARAARSVAGAEQLRRSAQPVENEAVLALIREARLKLGLARRIRVVMTDKLTSPAVAGILLPTLILPISLMTAMPLPQLQLIVLHELAHIRRGDYLANLFQLLVESLLFFNPAVWWISRQTRQECEACCDALAIALAAGQRLEYARTLAEVAEQSLAELPAAAAGFANRNDQPGLKDRVQRVLVPGYRPNLRLTWRALAGSLVCGGVLLLLSALGTQWTVQAAARLLTPQERVDRIETALKDLGQSPESFADNATNQDPGVELTLHVSTVDGSPLPRNALVQYFNQSQSTHGSSVGWLKPDQDGICHVGKVRQDQTIYLGTVVSGYAPASLGPINLLGSNQIGRLELTLERGFPVSVQVLDVDSGKAIPGASITYGFSLPNGNHSVSFFPWKHTADESGVVHVTNCADMPLHVGMATAGYEEETTVLEHLSTNAELKIYARRASPVAGFVTDATSGKPISGASVFVMIKFETAIVNWMSDPWRLGETPAAKTDQDGHFTIENLPRSARYWLLAKAAGHGGNIMADVRTGQTNLSVSLGPEIIVRGRIEGDFSALPRDRGTPYIFSFYGSIIDGQHSGFTGIVPLRVENGVGYFEFTNIVAGPAEVSVGPRGGAVNFTTNATAPVDNWVIKLAGTSTAAKRPVIIRFKTASKVVPKGTVVVNLPGLTPDTAIRQELELTDGEVQCEASIGGSLSIEPGHTAGFWFDHQGATIEAGTGAQVISVPTVPAGAIYALARNLDGSVAGDVMFSVHELKKSPLTPSTLFSLPREAAVFSDEGPRHYVANPLPLGGTYAIAGYRENDFSATGPIAISDANPDRHVELQMHKGARVEGQVFAPSGQPLTNVSISMFCDLLGSTFGLKPPQTNQTGWFAFDNCDPASGKFMIDVISPGLRGERLEVNMNKLPLSVHLSPGLKIFGQVINGKTGKPIPRAKVNAYPASDRDYEQLPFGNTVADDTGRFELDTLSDASYYVNAIPDASSGFGSGGYSSEMQEFRAGRKKAVVIKLVPTAAGH